MATVDISRLLDRLAERAEGPTRRAILSAIGNLKASLPAGIDRQSLDRWLASASTRQAFQPLEREIAKVLTQAASAAGRALPMNFKAVNPAVQKYAARYSARLVTEITKDQRTALRGAVGRAFRDGVAPRALGRQIRPLIGLHSSQVRIVERLRESLRDDGFSASAIASAVDRKSEQLVRRRADTIARTETLRAANKGQQAQWVDAARHGDIGGQMRRVWIATPDNRLCPICEELDGQQVDLDEPFHSDVAGEDYDTPPAHPQCRCSMGLEDVTEGSDKDGDGDAAREVAQIEANAGIADLDPEPPRFAWPSGDVMQAELRPGLQSHAADQWQRMDALEQDAIRRYTESSYDTNQILRSSSFDVVADRQLEAVKSLLSGMMKVQPLPEPMVAWRGVTGTKLGNELAVRARQSLVTKEPLNVRGMMSLSIDPSAADSFSSGVVFEVKTARGIYVEAFSTYPLEREFIVPHGAKLRVISVQERAFGGPGGGIRTIIRVEVE